MLKASVLASDKNKEIESSINEFKSPSGRTVGQKRSVDQISPIRLTVEADAKFLNLSIKPNLMETELKTKRFNRALELGYTKPRITTASR